VCAVCECECNLLCIGKGVNELIKQVSTLLMIARFYASLCYLVTRMCALSIFLFVN